ncbi:hypothetical protein [Streptomyces litchfieldiae]|uniref:Uncharacterized protein n=1 Tax=Streptomyces litchfieldiae TaxID=3075543 RepID=A0ABU2MMK5_9ACTN|nr:hypothetical protein [Streptomyces sp. DSM 44938]MDT0342657.1 hypothetical protein [Streptomyces sp. DSM 44938]
MADTGETAPCDLVTVPAREGLEAVDILRLRHGVGPVLHDSQGDTLGFIVPPGTAERWDLPGSACTQTYPGTPRGEQPPVTGSGWLVPPEGAVIDATEPERLRAALNEAVSMLRVVDRCTRAPGGGHTGVCGEEKTPARRRPPGRD